MKWIGDSDMKKNILLGTVVLFFFKKMTEVTLAVKTVQKKMTMCKKDNRPPHQKSRFFIASKDGGLSLDI